MDSVRYNASIVIFIILHYCKYVLFDILQFAVLSAKSRYLSIQYYQLFFLGKAASSIHLFSFVTKILCQRISIRLSWQPAIETNYSSAT